MLKAQGLDKMGQPFIPEVQEDAGADQMVFANTADDRAKSADMVKEAQRLSGLRKEAQTRGTWEGFKRPKDKADRLRAGVPWKFRTRGSFWGDVSEFHSEGKAG